MHQRFYLARRAALFYPEGDAGAATGGAAGDSGQGTAATAAAAAASASQSSTPDWREAITDADLKQYVTDKGFKEPGDVLKAVRDLEAKHTAPAKAEDYALGDTDFAKTASTWFHEQGISAEQAKGLTAKWNTFVEQQNTAAEQARQAEGEAQMTALKGEWGDSYDKNLELGRQAMRKFGVPVEVIETLAGTAGNAQTVKVFSQIGASLSEGTLNPGGAGSSGAASTDDEEAAASKFYSKSR
ncbi:hypothetical protein [Paraburkholderia unamae]|uniref:Uncharacterized protein n=1 Tax=Paraburkholderia unamae TaxID=219649 RepID=A0ABX5KPD7_9BURK|nr:hypothetical protein [Paraburkholderia unamae]PVX84345.1 hypothetical protein C7402_105186 [Paraburkholderia unamae]